MNLTVVTKSEFPGLRQSKPIFSINGKTGMFAFNKACGQRYSLKKGDNVLLKKDADSDPPDWYVTLPPTVQEQDDGFQLTSSNSQLRFSSKALARTMIMDFLKKRTPNTKEEDLSTNVIVHFRLAIKPVMDGDQEVPDTFAILGGTVYK